MSLSPHGSDWQESVEAIQEQMLKEFESALHSDVGVAVLRNVVGARSLEEKERSLLRFRAVVFPVVAHAAVY